MTKNVKSDHFFSISSRQSRKIAVETLTWFFCYLLHAMHNFEDLFMTQTLQMSFNYLLTDIPPPPPPINVGRPKDHGDRLASNNIEQGGRGMI